ncbi:unnamed protein product [Mytilus coruscus]|uniref:Phorbol-ester/DAG-type domain-containing protein n=1 Tax=Mytilus coruscus TaxID=42192 RepID=A0A6J8BPV4_MYTCO|nr:unnamed protein product [Mytilus coruscus]
METNHFLNVNILDNTEITTTNNVFTLSSSKSSQPTLAKQILLDENMENCPACLNVLTIEKSTCSSCCQQFHDQCFLTDSNLCYACHDIIIQNSIYLHINIKMASVEFKELKSLIMGVDKKVNDFSQQLEKVEHNLTGMINEVKTDVNKLKTKYDESQLEITSLRRDFTELEQGVAGMD